MRFIAALISLVLFLASAPAYANIKQSKAYKEAFPDLEKPKCIGCHVSEKPKKEGDHELNEYGKKAQAAKTGEEVDAETFKKVGPLA